MAALFGEQPAQWDVVSTAAVIGTLPALLLFFLFQRQLEESFTAGIGR